MLEDKLQMEKAFCWTATQNQVIGLRLLIINTKRVSLNSNAKKKQKQCFSLSNQSLCFCFLCTKHDVEFSLYSEIFYADDYLFTKE